MSWPGKVAKQRTNYQANYPIDNKDISPETDWEQPDKSIRIVENPAISFKK